MTEGLPLVSICLPIYNDEEFVGEALSSLVNQTYRNLEIIFSDNCSSDRSLEIIRGFNDPRIKIFHNEKNMGSFYNFMKVLNYANGKYMSYLSSDDKIELDAIEKAVKILEDENNRDIVLVNTWIETINNINEHIFTKKYLFGSGRISSYWGIRSNFLYGSNIIGEPNGSVWRTEAYRKIPEPKFSNSNIWTVDVDLKMELLLQGNTYMIPEPLGKFRISELSTSNIILKFSHARLWIQYAYRLYKDKRYRLGFGWVAITCVTSFVLQLLRNLFYILFIKKIRKEHTKNSIHA